MSDMTAEERATAILCGSKKKMASHMRATTPYASFIAEHISQAEAAAAKTARRKALEECWELLNGYTDTEDAAVLVKDRLMTRIDNPL